MRYLSISFRKNLSFVRMMGNMQMNFVSNNNKHSVTINVEYGEKEEKYGYKFYLIEAIFPYRIPTIFAVLSCERSVIYANYGIS